jgi:hypothetical protein
MDRFESAFEKFSSARRHLISIREEGEEESFRAALQDVKGALDLIGNAPLHTPAARHSLDVLRAAVREPAPDRRRMSAAVDEMASLLFWTETSLAF